LPAHNVHGGEFAGLNGNLFRPTALEIGPESGIRHWQVARKEKHNKYRVKLRFSAACSIGAGA